MIACFEQVWDYFAVLAFSTISTPDLASPPPCKQEQQRTETHLPSKVEKLYQLYLYINLYTCIHSVETAAATEWERTRLLLSCPLLLLQ